LCGGRPRYGDGRRPFSDHTVRSTRLDAGKAPKVCILRHPRRRTRTPGDSSGRCVIIVRMVDVTLNEAAGSVVVMKLQTPTWEVNIEAPAADFVRLRSIDDADWNARRSLAIGTSAGARVYWAISGEQAMILIGHDDETWDIAVAVPQPTVREIASLAERHMREHPHQDPHPRNDPRDSP
jgi:hypothetical protein